MALSTLIFQGPIIHRNFNTLPIIENHLLNSSHLFDNIIISTWENEHINDIEYLYKLRTKYNIDIILNEIPKIELINKQQYNNFLKYFATYSAIKSKHCQGEIIYKVRSDLSINLNEVVNFFTDSTQYNFVNQIGALWSYKTKPFAICDWMYVGSRENLFDICIAQMLYLNHTFSLRGRFEGLWPERESVLKYLFYKKIIDSKLFPTLTYLDFFPKIPKDISKSWRLALNGLNQNQIELQNVIFQLFNLLPEHIAEKASIRRSDNRPWQRSDLFFYEQQVEIQNQGYASYLITNQLLKYDFKITKRKDFRDNLVLNYLAIKLINGSLPLLKSIILFIGQELMTIQSRYIHLVRRYRYNFNKMYNDHLEV